jgi:hypothetical protein
MNDPKRLITGQDAFTRALLEDWNSTEEPSRAALGRTAQALGLAAIAGTTAASASAHALAAGGIAAQAAGHAAAGSAGGHLAAATALAGKLGLARWIGIGVLTGGVLAGGAGYVMTRTASHTGDSTVRVPAAQRSVSSPAARSKRPIPAERDRSGDAVDTHTPFVPEARSSDANRSVSPSLGREIQAIDAARQAIADHRPEDALAALERYEALRPSRVFRPEAELLRKEAIELERAGRR